jgi:hypothetical protein
MVYTIFYYKSRIHIIYVPVLPRTAPIQNWPLLSLTPATRQATPPPCERRPRPNVITTKALDDPTLLPTAAGVTGAHLLKMPHSPVYVCVCVCVCVHDLHNGCKCPHLISYCIYRCSGKIKYFKTSESILCES